VKEIECDTGRRDARQRVGGQTNTVNAQLGFPTSSTTDNDGESGSGYRKISMKRIEAEEKNKIED
jgi:hypothetical protein